jgi:hypothetical protein
MVSLWSRMNLKVIIMPVLFDCGSVLFVTIEGYTYFSVCATLL